MCIAEKHLAEGTEPQVPSTVRDASAAMFASPTQAFREVALGCLLTRIHQPDRNVRLPYIKQGAAAFNGRTLDETVVNPFLKKHRIPSSQGPYLSVFRRQVELDESTTKGLRHPEGYAGLLTLIRAIEREDDAARLRAYLVYMLLGFLRLREESEVDLLRLERVSLEQYCRIVAALLQRQSGGFLALCTVLAAVRAIKETLGLDWVVEHQGINVADRAREVGGDITIRSGDNTFMVMEVTERPVDKGRVASTFESKIAPARTNYVFVVHLAKVHGEALRQAEKYFAQGYDVDFVDLQTWIRDTLATLGRQGRNAFQDQMIQLLSGPEVPRMTKLAWNEALQTVL